MRIAVFTDLYLEVAGGIPSSIRAQKKALEDLGHEVVVFCPKSRDFEITEKNIVAVPTLKIKVNGAPMAKKPEKVMEFILAEFTNFGERFDVIHVHYESSCSIVGVKLARKFGLSLVQTMHGREDMAVAMNVPLPLRTVVSEILSSWHGHYLEYEERIDKDKYLASTMARAKMWALMVGQANAADVVVVPSRHFGEKLDYYGVKKPIRVISNGVSDDLAKIRDWPVRRRDERRTLRIIWTSRLSKEKRIIPFLRALMRVKKKDFYLTVVGSGNQQREAERLVRMSSFKDKVEFVGAVEHNEMLERLAEQDIMIMNSYGFDTQGLTLLEARATGLPVIFCDPNMRESVPEGGGIFVKSPKKSAMTEAIERLIANPSEIERMSKVMLARRAEVFQSTQIEKLVKVYQEIIQK